MPTWKPQLSVFFLESHKQMDEDAEIEAELQRQEELEDARNNMELPLPKDKQLVRACRIQLMLYSVHRFSHDNSFKQQFMKAEEEMQNRKKVLRNHHLRPHHKPITKQTSLPTNFTFNVRPPSPDILYSRPRDEDRHSSGEYLIIKCSKGVDSNVQFCLCTDTSPRGARRDFFY
jgi:hypothetical protein